MQDFGVVPGSGLCNNRPREIDGDGRPGRYLLVVRVLRLLRIFRVLKLGKFLSEGAILSQALRASRHKIFAFLSTVLTLVVLIGAVMCDVAPQTPLGKFLASLVMIIGYGIIAVPTGIVTSELAQASRDASLKQQACPACGAQGHFHDAAFCRKCGGALH